MKIATKNLNYVVRNIVYKNYSLSGDKITEFIETFIFQKIRLPLEHPSNNSVIVSYLIKSIQ